MFNVFPYQLKRNLDGKECLFLAIPLCGGMRHYQICFKRKGQPTKKIPMKKERNKRPAMSCTLKKAGYGSRLHL